MKTTELQEKVLEVECAMNERLGEIARTKTKTSDDQKLLTIQSDVEVWLSRTEKDHVEETQELLNKGDELLQALRLQV